MIRLCLSQRRMELGGKLMMNGVGGPWQKKVLRPIHLYESNNLNVFQGLHIYDATLASLRVTLVFPTVIHCSK